MGSTASGRRQKYCHNAGMTLAHHYGAAVVCTFLPRPLEEDPQATIEEAALAASCLAALPGVGYPEAAQTLKAMAERASRRRREQGIA